MTPSALFLCALPLFAMTAALAGEPPVAINLHAVEELAGPEAAARVDAGLNSDAAGQNKAAPKVRNPEAASPVVGDGDLLQILYAHGNLVISPSARETLDDWAGHFLKADSKVEILSYSGASAPAWAKNKPKSDLAPQNDIRTYSLHEAIRTAFKRALTVRAILVERGVPEDNITVRAIGPAGGRGPAERIDVIALKG